jgi:ribonuclease HII
MRATPFPLRAVCLAVVLLCVLQVTRDRMMQQLDQQYPQYGFAQHKGYGVSGRLARVRDAAGCDTRWFCWYSVCSNPEQ